MSESGGVRECRAGRVGRAGAVLVASALLGFSCASDSTTPADDGEAPETSQGQASAAVTSAATTGTTTSLAEVSVVSTTTQPKSPGVTTQAPSDTSQPATGTTGTDAISGDVSDERSDSDAASATVPEEAADSDAVDEQAAASEEAVAEPEVELEPEFVRWDPRELQDLFPHCPPPDVINADSWAQWSAHYDSFQRAHLAGRSVEIEWQPGVNLRGALYDRIRGDGYTVDDDASQWATAEGIVPHRSIRTADRVADVEQITLLLRDWLSYRYQLPPDGNHAPPAWGLRIIFDSVSDGCVVNTM